MDKIKEYAVTNYPKTLKMLVSYIEENDVVYFVHLKRWPYSNNKET